MKLLVDEDTLSSTLVARLQAAEHEVLRLPEGSSDEVVFTEAQRLAVPVLTARQILEALNRLTAQEQRTRSART